MCTFAATQLSQIGIEVEQLLACGLPFELTEELYRVLYIMTQVVLTGYSVVLTGYSELYRVLYIMPQAKQIAPNQSAPQLSSALA